MNPLMQSTVGANPRLASLIQMLRGKNPEQIAMSMMQQNPQFRQFVEMNKGKTPEQVAREHGIDLSQIMNQM